MHSSRPSSPSASSIPQPRNIILIAEFDCDHLLTIQPGQTSASWPTFYCKVLVAKYEEANQVVQLAPTTLFERGGFVIAKTQFSLQSRSFHVSFDSPCGCCC